MIILKDTLGIICYVGGRPEPTPILSAFPRLWMKMPRQGYLMECMVAGGGSRVNWERGSDDGTEVRAELALLCDDEMGRALIHFQQW